MATKFVSNSSVEVARPVPLAGGPDTTALVSAAISELKSYAPVVAASASDKLMLRV